jgi:hypothetical protein
MNIINKTYKWASGLSKRKSTKYIIIHHAAASISSPDQIHAWHLNNGWSGIGYNFVVRKDGSIYTGRPIDCTGAHTTNYNSISIGICFEGDYTKETVPEPQKQAGKELITYLKGLYPEAQIKRHKDFASTACPGSNFPFVEIAEGATIKPRELTSVNDIVWELNYRGIITNIDLWMKKLEEDTNAYWLAYKCANMTKNI